MGFQLWQSGVGRLVLASVGVLVVCAVELFQPSILLAQQTEPAAPAPVAAAQPDATTPPVAEDLPGEVLPKVYLLPDKRGNLQAIPGFTLEQFTELFKLKNQIAQQGQRPRYSIESLEITGTAEAQRAELTADFQIVVHESGWVGVPLRLLNAVLREGAEFTGPGDHFLHFEPEGEGFVAWIHAEPASTHRVRLKLLAPLTQLGAETSLRLIAPRAAVSQLNLQVPLERVTAKVSEGSTLEAVRPLEGGKCLLKVVGLGGQCELAWHAANSQVVTLSTVLEAAGEIAVRVSGRAIHTDAKLSVRSIGGEFDRFQVRLPPGAEYVGTAPTGATIVAVDTGGGEKGKLYEVKLEKKTTGPFEIRLATERTQDATRADESLQLAGFEVVGAVRQGGTVAVQVDGNWQILWGESNHVRQIAEPAGPRRENLSAAFEYVAQPFSLMARVIPQKTRIRVEPEYVLLIGSEEVQLRARLKYTIRGAKVRALELLLPDWEVDMVGPGNLVNVDAAVTGENDPLVIPLLEATSGELEITLDAHRKILPGTNSVTLDLPQPKGEVVAPANVAVVPADHIELTSDPNGMVALAPQTVRPQMQLPPRQQDPLFFRTEGAAARFAAAVKVHEQAITAASVTQLEVDERETRVEQHLVFQIAYQPTDHLMLGVPPTVRADRVTISLDGQRLPPVAVRERAAEAVEAGPVRVQLPEPRIGRCELQLNYVVRHEKPPSSADATVSVPLIVPGQGQVTSNELLISPMAGVIVAYNTGAWTKEARPAAEAPTGLQLSARRALPEVTLALRSKQRPVEAATTIERAWLQTRLTGSDREDQVVLQLATSEPRLELALPQGVDMKSLTVELDGVRVMPDAVRQRDVSLVLSGPARLERVLQLRYHFAEPQALGHMVLEGPQLKSAPWVRQSFWQVLLPSDEHLLFTPAHFTSEFYWSWNGWWWSRQPSLSTAELAQWSHAVGNQSQAEEPLEAAAANRYLFSTVGRIEPLVLTTASRARLVLWASFPLLLAGLLLIYVPSARQTAVFFVLGVALVAGSLIDPDLAVLVAQAGCLGLVLAVLAAVLSRMSGRPVPPPSTPVAVRGSSRAVIERNPTEIYQRGPTSPASTTTDPLVPTTSGDSPS